jgi:hypothetical protein
MFRVKVVQALHGDCLIVEYGSPEDRNFLLIDGGPSTVYDDHLKTELLALREQGGKINIAVLSHVDDDHVNGLLDLLHDLVDQRRAHQPETIVIGGLWHNSFSQTLGPAVENGLARSMGSGVLPRGAMPSMEIEARSISQGDELAAYARGLKIPINVEFRDTPDRVICVDNLDRPIQLANLNITVVGPTRRSLQALQKVPLSERRLQLSAQAEGRRGVLVVRDSGPGIAPEALPRLFEPFFSTREGGLGLGLSLCETLAAGMGGELTGGNAATRGAEFRLSLPLASGPTT